LRLKAILVKAAQLQTSNSVRKTSIANCTMPAQKPNQNNFTSFADWCLHKDSISEAARHTVEVLLEVAGTSEGDRANEILLSRTELDLRHNQIVDLSPLSVFANLKYLYLSKNQIADLSPLFLLTNLEDLYLSENQIADLNPLFALTNLTYLIL
jgi:internalin A